MTHVGLSSQEAQQRLYEELQRLASNTTPIRWTRELCRRPFVPLTFTLVLISGVLLVADYAVSESDAAVLFQGVFLLLTTAFNSVLFFWDVYILRTHRIKRLLRKVEPFLSSPCPWSPGSYPARSIATLRGNFTIRAYRDGVVVNLPTNLLVEGDVIELYEGMTTPANVVLLDPATKEPTDVNFLVGEVLPDEIFRVGHERTCGIGKDDADVRFLPAAKGVQFAVTDAPVVAVLKSTIGKKRSQSFVCCEKDCALGALNIAMVIVLPISLIVNLIRYLALPDDFDVWYELLFRLQSYTTVPLLMLPLPLLWIVVNIYGTARIVLLVEKGPSFFKGLRGVDHLRNVYQIVKKMLCIVLRPSMYPNYRSVHLLGSLTSFCAVDKEYVLTGGSPTPEKVFFFRYTKAMGLDEDDRGNVTEEDGNGNGNGTEEDRNGNGTGDVTEEDRNGNGTGGVTEEDRNGNGTGDVTEEDRNGNGTGDVTKEDRNGNGTGDVTEEDRNGNGNQESKDLPPAVSEENQTHTAEPVNFKIPNSSADDARNGGSERHPPSTSGERYAARKLQFGDKKETSRSKRQEEPPAHLQPPKPPDNVSTTSTVSEAAPFEVVTEVLDLSSNSESHSGLCFDDVNWEAHIGSLKPVGVNVLASSHLFADPYLWSPEGTNEQLRKYLQVTGCLCPLGVEIGVTEYSTNQFANEVLLYSLGNPPEGFQRSTLSRKACSSLFNAAQIVQPHIVSTALRNNESGTYLVMSRGSGDMVSACCSDFWDGRDLQPMTDLERGTILDFFTRRSLSSYCVTLAYNPLLEFDLAHLRNEKLGIFLPERHMQRNFSDMSMMMLPDTASGGGNNEEGIVVVPRSSSAEQIFASLQCNQVFLGMVSLQFQPQQDVVTLIEDLETAGIRFVHFTAENEVRGKIFAQKLGLEAGWNCHISLADSLDEDDVSSSSEELDSTTTSASSSLSSVVHAYAYKSYITAKLPKGITNVRPHIKNVDNVPLLVPLFTDCTTDAVREMMEIMQENGEVVMCIGNSWNGDNLLVFSQADISLSITPNQAKSSRCPTTIAQSLQSSHSEHFSVHSASQQQQHALNWPTPLEMASFLNSSACQLSCNRDNNISVISLVTESRHILSCVRRGFLFWLGSSLSLSLLILLATLFFLPPPLSGSHIFWFVLFVFPTLAVSFIATPVDPAIQSQMPNRTKQVWSDKWFFLVNLLTTFVPTTVIDLLLFALTVGAICSEQPNADCHPLLGDRNETQTSLWNGWRGDYEQGLVFAQDLVAFFITVSLVALSIRFVHRTKPLWKLWRFISWQYSLTVTGAVLLQVIYSTISQSVTVSAYQRSQIARLSSVPWYVWVIGFSWPFLLLPVQELLKYWDKKTLVKVQRHLRLEFETKLGMNSPF